MAERNERVSADFPETPEISTLRARLARVEQSAREWCAAAQAATAEVRRLQERVEALEAENATLRGKQ